MIKASPFDFGITIILVILSFVLLGIACKAVWWLFLLGWNL